MEQRQQQRDVSLPERLRADARHVRVDPAAGFHARVMRSIEASEGFDHRRRVVPPTHPNHWHRSLVVAAVVVFGLLAWIFTSASRFGDVDGVDPLADASAVGAGPALVQPLRDGAPKIRVHLEAPYWAEVDRFLVDAGAAGRAMLGHLPLRGQPAEAVELE